MLVNNFKDLPPDNKHRLDPFKQREIQQGVWKSLSVFKYVGQIVEVFLPKLVDMFVIAAGGSDLKDKALDDHTPPNKPPGSDPKNIKPRTPGN